IFNVSYNLIVRYDPLVRIRDNLADVRKRIASAAVIADRDPAEIKLVAVCKTKPVDLVLDAIQAGVTIFGENRMQEAKAKWPEFKDELKARGGEFHLVGHLQRNKAKDAVQLFDLIHSIDSERIAEEVNIQAEKIDKFQRVLIEVNTSGESSKYGCSSLETEALVNLIRDLPYLKLEGLMTIGPLYGGIYGARECFGMLAKLRNDFGGPAVLPELSMGMTGDFEVAIEEGATLVRIGTAIFGSRN
ncbi:MAG: YggS family pyridoxal phosphate-dependent enzyme, partial [bacterium]